MAIRRLKGGAERFPVAATGVSKNPSRNEHEGRNVKRMTTPQDKTRRVAKMIEEMMDIKLREHDRKHHFDHSKPPEDHEQELQRSMVDQNSLRGIQANLANAIEDLFRAGK